MEELLIGNYHEENKKVKDKGLELICRTLLDHESVKTLQFSRYY